MEKQMLNGYCRLRITNRLSIVGLFFSLAFLQGCQSLEQNIGLATATAAITPSNEIEQVFYVGMFDPQDQVPPTIYRIRINGQASALNRMKFGSGWVQAELIDSLTSQQELTSQTKELAGDKSLMLGNQTLGIDSQRTMVAFGPEGFRITPKNHRLAVVMGASPEAFFSSVDRALGERSKIQNSEMSQDLVRLLFEALKDSDAQQESLDAIPPMIAKEE